MGDRIEDAREGRLDWRELTPQERQQLRLLDGVVGEVRRVVDTPAPPDVTEAVLRRIAGIRPAEAPALPGESALRRRLFARRTIVLEFRLAPLLAAAAVLMLLAGVARWQLTLPTGAEAAPAVFVQFRLHAPGAARVQLAGSFTQWRADHALYETSPGVWIVTVPLESGIHDYSFLVDGTRWTVDPYAPAIDDGFGGSANRLSLLAPERES